MFPLLCLKQTSAFQQWHVQVDRGWSYRCVLAENIMGGQRLDGVWSVNTPHTHTHTGLNKGLWSWNAGRGKRVLLYSACVKAREERNHTMWNHKKMLVNDSNSSSSSRWWYDCWSIKWFYMRLNSQSEPWLYLSTHISTKLTVMNFDMESRGI